MSTPRHALQPVLQIGVAALLVVAGTLQALVGLRPGGWAPVGWFGLLLAVVALVMLVVGVRRSLRGTRHED